MPDLGNENYCSLCDEKLGEYYWECLVCEEAPMCEDCSNKHSCGEMLNIMKSFHDTGKVDE